MKPALYYAIRRNGEKDVVAITSVKDGRRSGWNGRYVSDNTPTHGKFDRHDGIMGRFPTQEAAEAKRSELIKIAASYDAKREPHQEAISALYREERAAIEKATTDVQS